MGIRQSGLDEKITAGWPLFGSDFLGFSIDEVLLPTNIVGESGRDELGVALAPPGREESFAVSRILGIAQFNKIGIGIDGVGEHVVALGLANAVVLAGCLIDSPQTVFFELSFKMIAEAGDFTPIG